MTRLAHRASRLLAVLLLAACSAAPVVTAPEPAPVTVVPEAERLAAFTRLYGLVRYFHPSDEAAAIDWDRFAVYAAGRVLETTDPAALPPLLEELFLPLAPSLKLYPAGAPPPDTQRLLPAEPGLPLVSWQHFGAGLGETDLLYRSARLHRAPPPRRSESAGSLLQRLDAAPYRGMRIRLGAALRVEPGDENSHGHLWLQVNRGANQLGFFDNMKDRPVRAGEWRRYRIEGTVAEDAATIFVGAFLRGRGRMWLDEVKLEVAPARGGRWRKVALGNAGFEEGEGQAVPKWEQLARSYRFRPDSERPRSGRYALRIELPSGGEPLFAERAAAGEVVERPLGAGLMAQLPLALHSDAAGTLPRDPQHPLAPLQSALPSASIGADEARVRIAGVAIAWNALRHFYPYSDEVDVDWDAELSRALGSALQDRDAAQFQQTLQRLLVPLRDGHADASYRQPLYHVPPFAVEEAEGRVVVTHSKLPEQIRAGDVVLALDGVDAPQQLRETAALFSGSPQWRRWRALRRFGAGDKGSLARLLLERAGQRIEIEAERSHPGPVALPPRPAIQLLSEGIRYVDLSVATLEQLRARIGELASARGVVFDLRGRPNGNEAILRHLLRAPDTTDWMHTPQLIRPGFPADTAYTAAGWRLQPQEPRIAGRVVFLADGSCISYCESLLGYVQGLGLGEIAGSPSAGANGNLRRVPLPGGFEIGFTGMRVTRFDGAVFHGQGLQPTLPVARTVSGIAAGRDEVLDAAVEWIAR